ncbi:formate/nitrite transporter family protein [Arthrobacter sp. PAMC 25486]|uniref:formate/nitrite transporter family protein n=1 Tax=Arthrobacter sp. PAMC 25486 TaxID=1494608 RepID=UPI000535E458|nr:formate/nitrite transporter family protein [Arthrobacter sp. PAMC 25486]AIY00927.1 formate/nitrite transporter family protein [Arthrobacter sp. PAMC 25486]
MDDEQRRRELGDNDAPVEEELETAFERIVEEGAQRLHRSWSSLLVTGVFGGMEVGLGVMAYLAVDHATGNKLLAGLAFSIGFIALLLAKSELFTEGFLVPIAAVAAKEARVGQLLKLWTGTLLANLAGGWIIMWLVMQGFPEWRETVVESATHYALAPLSVQTAALAVLGGSTITLMTRMQHGTDCMPAKIVAAVGGAFLLAGLPLFHSVLDSLLIFGAIHAGAPFGYLQWLNWFWYTVLFNVAGGVVLVTALRLVRTRELVSEKRKEAEAEGHPAG